MKLRLDLIVPALLIASAGSQLNPTDSGPAAQATADTCAHSMDLGKRDAEARIAAEGYAEVRILGIGCDNAWHAIALAEGDPVRLKVTTQGMVLTE